MDWAEHKFDRVATLLAASVLSGALVGPAAAEAVQEASPPPTQSWALHAQATVVEQATFAFRSPYRGPNSLDPGTRGKETADVTLYAGVRAWPGLEVWINPELDQGFGLSNTLGVAGFPSGEAYKVGMAKPYFRLQRLFVRHVGLVDTPANQRVVDIGQRHHARRDRNRFATQALRITAAIPFFVVRINNFLGHLKQLATKILREHLG